MPFDRNIIHRYISNSIKFVITVSINNKIMSKSSEFRIYATDIYA